MNFMELFPGRFLKAFNLKEQDRTLTIADVTLEDLPDDQGVLKKRPVMSFEKTKLQLVLNRTNAECIRAMFGDETSNWIGKRVTFFPAEIPAFGGVDIAIRVRGSPDIDKAIPVEIRLPRRKPYTMKMERTGIRTNGKVSPPPPPRREPPPPSDEGLPI